MITEEQREELRQLYYNARVNTAGGNLLNFAISILTALYIYDKYQFEWYITLIIVVGAFFLWRIAARWFGKFIVFMVEASEKAKEKTERMKR